MTVDYTLYGADHSLFTGKVRPYFKFKDLDWVEKPATKKVYKELILPKVGAPIVPIIETRDGTVVQDTTEIIDFLEKRHPQCPVYPSSPKQRLISLLIEHYADEWLVIPAMHYRWTVLEQQRDFIYREFGRLSNPDASEEEQIAIGEKTGAPFRKSITALGVNATTIPEIERTYLEFLHRLNAHFSEHDYLFGSRPSIGDFGLMGPLYAHLGRDPVPKALMQAEAPEVVNWIQRMNDPTPLSGHFYEEDVIPETLLPILKTLSLEFLPDVLSVVEHNARWLEGHPDEKIPRFLGMHDFRIGEARSQRVVSSYSQWMFQRSWRFYQALSRDEKASIDPFLQDIGAWDAMQIEITHPVARCLGQLELVAAN